MTDEVVASAEPTVAVGPEADEDRPDESGRRLFSYVTGTEWEDYRAILAVFAGTFFSEFTPDEVVARLDARGVVVDLTVVADRLESLRRWGNLAVSSSIGSPTSLDDYYRRRNRYLITRAGQEVHDLVEAVLGRVDEVRDVTAGRLRSLLDALRALIEVDVATVDPSRLADMVRAAFDPHAAFTSEVTQFFAALNQWQSRYDLSEAELAFFARVLVTYVSDRLDEIERTARPVGLLLEELAPRVPTIVERVERGLAGRVEEAGLGQDLAVSHEAGTSADDWEHLRSWFLPHAGRPARLVQLKGDAVAAVRTLTMNLTRLSRVGVGGSSRRGDLVSLAGIFAAADPDRLPALAHAAFGLAPTVHYGLVAGDSDDPVPSGTTWPDAPPAIVPVSLRERGDRANRGSSTPLRDRSTAQRLLRERREEERAARELVDRELAGLELDGAILSVPALHRLQGLVGAALAQIGPTAAEGVHDDGALRCHVRRVSGETVVVGTDEGTLRLDGVQVTIEMAAEIAGSVG